MKWTDETVELLKKLHAQGLSAGQISDRLGCTRNSICGKLERLGLRGGKKVRPRPRQSSIEKPPRSIFNPTFSFGKMPIVTPPLAEEQKEYILGQGVPLSELRDHRCGCALCVSLGPRIDPQKCKWPINEPKRDGSYLFCGAYAPKGCPYCKYHWVRSRGRWTAEAA